MAMFEHEPIQAHCQTCDKVVTTKIKRKLRGVEGWKRFYWNYCSCICCIPVAFCPTKKHRVRIHFYGFSWAVSQFHAQAFNTVQHHCPHCRQLLGKFFLRTPIILEGTSVPPKT